MRSLHVRSKWLLTTAFSAAMLTAAVAHAQYHPDYGYDRPPAGEGGYYGGGGTAAAGAGIGAGAAAAGAGQLATGLGQADVSSAQAEQMRLQAQSQHMDNVLQKQQTNQELQESQQAFESEEEAESAKEVQQYRKYYQQLEAAHRLSNDQLDRTSNVIHWPYVLRSKEYSDVRFTIDKLFGELTPEDSGMGSAHFTDIQNACQEMDGILKQEIETLNTMAYITARHFIDSLAYEERFPVK